MAGRPCQKARCWIACLCPQLVVALMIGCGAGVASLDEHDSVTAESLDSVPGGLAFETSWLGNSFPSSREMETDVREKRHVIMDANHMAVRKDGLMVAGGPGETKRWAALFHGGDIVLQLDFRCGNMTGGAPFNIHALAIGERHIYVALGIEHQSGKAGDTNAHGKRVVPPEGKMWMVVRRYGMDGKDAPFADAYGSEESFLLVQEVPSNYNGDFLYGLALDDHERLYVASTGHDRVKVYDGESMRFLTEFAMPKPTRLQADSHGRLWVATKEAHGRVLAVTQGDTASAGRRLDELTIQLGSGTFATAMTWDPRREQLLVATNRFREGIRRYEIPATGEPTRMEDFGQGLLSGSGQQIGRAGARRWYGITALGMDVEDRLYVASTGKGPSWSHLPNLTDHRWHGKGFGTVLECYRLHNGSRLWELHGLEFVDNAVADWRNPEEVFTVDTHYHVDYTRPAGTQATVVGRTVDPERYPEDRRYTEDNTGRYLADLIWIRGRKYLLVAGMKANWSGIFRFNPSTDGEVAIPTAWFDRNGQVWVDDGFGGGQADNGRPDGAEIRSGVAVPREFHGIHLDSSGHFWAFSHRRSTPIHHFAASGFTTGGVPRYSMEAETVPFPEPFNDLQGRFHYDRPSDTVYLSSYTPDAPTVARARKTAGRVILRYRNWSKGNRQADPGFQIVMPETDDNYPADWNVAGDYVFVSYFKGAEVRIFRRSDGQEVTTGTLDNEGSIWSAREPGVLRPWGRPWTALVDIAHGSSAVKLKDNRYAIFVEDDLAGKILYYVWNPAAQAPGVPSDLVIESASRSVKLAWPEVSDEAGYGVERQLLDPEKGWGAWEVVTRTIPKNKHRYIDPLVATGRRYNYRVFSIGSDGTASSVSVERQATVTAD